MFREGTEPLVRAEEVTRTYRVGSREVLALQGASISLDRGQMVALRGRSGSGKTTLLNCLGGLDRPNSGQIWFHGREITGLPERELVRLRRLEFGFVFQSHALLMTYSARENVDVMLRLAGVGRRERRERTEEVLALVGLARFMEHRPFELSGGQQQRVTIARAIATKPALILADEPTGELDTATGRQIYELFHHIAHGEGTTVLTATHDLAIDTYADRVYLLEDGRVEGRVAVQQGAAIE
jgi:ABC-type lipoprotein export system ATPase subunit